MYKKKIIFLTGTRADYGKLKPLIFSTLKSKRFETSIIATGMHLQKLYGYTYIEIKKDFGKNLAGNVKQEVKLENDFMQKSGWAEFLAKGTQIWITNGADKKISKKEKSTAKFAFASVVSLTNIEKGELFSKKNIWVKRPGTGYFPAHKYYKLIGKKAKRFIKCDIFISKRDV